MVRKTESRRMRGSRTHQLRKECKRVCHITQLDVPLISHITSYLTTTQAARLCRCSRDFHHTINSTDCGVFRDLVAAYTEDGGVWEVLASPSHADEREQAKKKLASIVTAYIDTTPVRCEMTTKVSPVLADILVAARGTLTSIHVKNSLIDQRAIDFGEPGEDDNDDDGGDDDDDFEDDGTDSETTRDSETAPEDASEATEDNAVVEAVVFDKVETLTAGMLWLRNFALQEYSFPSLRVLHVNKSSHQLEEAITLPHILSTSPQLEEIHFERLTEFFDWIHWHVFTQSLGLPPKLATLTGLEITEHSMAGLGDLVKGLDKQWGKPENKDVRKRLGIKYDCNVSAKFGEQVVTRTSPTSFVLPDLLEWAKKVSCAIEWQGEVHVDCTVEAADQPQAVIGPVADIIRDLASKQKEVHLYHGGDPLDKSWSGALLFPRAKSLRVEPFGNVVTYVPAATAVESVPMWLSEQGADGNNRHFPALESLSCMVALVTHVNKSNGGALADETKELPDGEPHALSKLVGSLATLTDLEIESSSMFTAAKLLSYVSAKRLAKCSITLGHHVTDLPETLPHQQMAFPRVDKLTVRMTGMRHSPNHASVLSCMRLVGLIRPDWADVMLAVDGLEDGRLAFCFECVDRLGGGFDVRCARVTQTPGQAVCVTVTGGRKE